MSLVKHTHSNFSHHDSELDSVRAQLARAEGHRNEQAQRRAKIRAITTAGQPEGPITNRLHRVNTLIDLPDPDDGVCFGHMAHGATSAPNPEQAKPADQKPSEPTSALGIAALNIMLVLSILGAAYTAAPLLRLLPAIFR